MPRKAKSGKMKLKTHKATSKRFRLTGSGKVVRTKGGKSHLRRNTSKRTKSQLSEMHEVMGRTECYPGHHIVLCPHAVCGARPAGRCHGGCDGSRHHMRWVAYALRR